MADTNVDSSTMDNETAEVFVKKLDMACIALNNPNQNIEGYGVGMEAAYQLLCEAQAMSPDNQAIATEIATLQHLMHAADDENTANVAPALPETSNSPVTNETHSFANQVMQHWNTKPIIEVLVCVTESNLKSLADTIDSIAAQIYSNWKLTVISNMPSPDPVFSQHDILQWIQTSDFQQSLDSIINESNSDWLGVIKAGGQLDSEALFSLANQDNLKGHKWQVVYSDEDQINIDKTYSSPILKPDFDPQHFLDSDLIGEFCFVRSDLLKQIGGIRLDVNHSNTDLLARAIRNSGASIVGHIPSILYHRANPISTDISQENKHQLQSNVA